MKTKIRRNRAIKSCSFCYTHKHQCNKLKPKCNLCLKYNRDNCIYGFNKYLKEPEPEPSPIQSKEKDSTKFISNAFYPYFDDLSNISYLVESRDSHNMSSPYSFSFLDVSYTSRFTLAQTLKLLPSKRDCKKFIRQYFSNIHPMIPILNVQTTSQDIESLLNRTTDENIDVNSLLILFAILFSVSLSSKIHNGYKDIDQTLIDSYTIYELYGAVEYLRQLLKFPSDPTIACIESSLIVYTVGSTNYKDLLAQLATLTRSAEILGLHRDPSKLRVDAKGFQMEPKRRKLLWHFVMQAESMSSVYYGLSSLASKVDYDTGIPSYYEGDQNQIINPSLAFSVAKFKSGMLISKLIDTLNGTLRPNSALVSELFQQVLNLYNDCNVIINDISYCLNNDPYSNWLTANISVLVHRCYLLWERINYSLSKSLSNIKIVASKQAHTPNYSKDSMVKNLLKPSSVDSMGLKVAILLLYATSERLCINCYNEKFLWYIRYCQPFQYLLILLRDINVAPSKPVDFNEPDMPQAIAQYIPHEILTKNDVDHRVVVTNMVISKLEVIKEFWPESVKKRFELIKGLKEYVFQKLDHIEYNDDGNNHNNPNNIRGTDIDFAAELDQLFRGNDDIFGIPNFTLDTDFHNPTW